jgi:hypothetical protein
MSSVVNAQLNVYMYRHKSGVDVLITIFCEKFGVFLKNHCYDANFTNISSSLNKRTPLFFAKLFGENIFKP